MNMYAPYELNSYDKFIVVKQQQNDSYTKEKDPMHVIKKLVERERKCNIDDKSGNRQY